jgi:hypothetical protein
MRVVNDRAVLGGQAITVARRITPMNIDMAARLMIRAIRAIRAIRG